MADMLSQDEINALLGGLNTDDESKADEAAGSDTSDSGAPGSDSAGDENLIDMLTSEQRDVLGEVGNISMGTAATTLYALLDQNVSITTPVVSVVRWADVTKEYERPCVGIRVNYVEGIKGSNVLILKHHDVKVITSLMMGWGGVVEGDEEINEMDLSAISEAMNQMIGSSSTSIASLIKEKIDIDTPKAFVMDLNDQAAMENLDFAEEFSACVKFRMQIGDLIDSEIMQLLPLDFARSTAEKIKSFIREMPPTKEETPQPQATQAPPQPANTGGMNNMSGQTQPYAPQPDMYQQPMQQGMYQQPMQQPGMYQQPMYAAQPMAAAQPAQFQNFDVGDVMQQKENIEIIMDVPLEVTVELGRTSRKIKEILEFSPGSIIELNKLAGEPIDILVNGKFVAKGEVVVIDENFGVRIVEVLAAQCGQQSMASN